MAEANTDDPSTAAAPIGGLHDQASYYVIKVDNQTVQLISAAPIDVDASAATGTAHRFTPSSGPALTFDPASAVDSAADTFHFASAHGLTTGATVVYSNGGGTSISGLTNGTTYYVIKVDDHTLMLSAIVNLDASAALFTNNVGHSLRTVLDLAKDDRVALAAAERADLTFAYVFNPTSGGVVSGNAIQFSAVHGLSTGDAIVYDNGGGTSLGGLTNGTTCYVVKVSDTTVKLAATYDQAVAASPTVITLSTAGVAGTQHSLRIGDGVRGAVGSYHSRLRRCWVLMDAFSLTSRSFERWPGPLSGDRRARSAWLTRPRPVETN